MISKERRELRGAWRWLAGTVAVLIMLGIVGGLVYYRLTARPGDNQTVGSTLSGVGLRCRLPVLTVAAAGFISLPDGAVVIDRGVAVDPSKGARVYTYDAQLARWVPVAAPAISPDGRSYAYLITTGVPGQAVSMSLHRHEIASGKDRVLWEVSGSPVVPDLGWLPSGIYFSAVLGATASPGISMPPSVYVSDPDHAQAPRRVGPTPAPQLPGPAQPDYSGPDVFYLFGGGAAWGMGHALSPHSPSGPGPYGPDRVLRMDLLDGSVSTWYMATSGADFLHVVGLDGLGHPILALSQLGLKSEPPLGAFEPPPNRILLLTGPGQTVDITAGNTNFHFGSAPAADSHGIWLGSWNSVWLYGPSGGLRQVATIPGGVFPSPSPPSELPPRSVIPSDAMPEVPAYMQGTLVTPAGPCT